MQTVTLMTCAPRTVAAVHARVPVGGVGHAFRPHLDQVYEAARAGTVQLDGQNVFIYRCVAERPNELDVAFGVGITAPFSGVGNVRPTELPAGEVATATHWGSYAHQAITDWCEMNGRRTTGTSWEVYGHWTDDDKSLRTDVFYLLEPAG
jgi:effector-binding domain-containing protein